ncbi:hypothetical protein, partial [Enterobacter asburiae]
MNYRSESIDNWYKIVVHSESKRKGNLLLFGDFVAVETNPWFDSESGHHYLKNPAYGWVFAFLRLYIPSLYSYFSLSWDRAVCVAGWRLCLIRPTKRHRAFLRAQSKKPRTLRYGVLLIDAWQFPTLTWGD